MRKRAQEYQDNPVAFVAEILDVDIYSAEPEARVIINQRTGTIVISGDVTIGDVVISHNNVVIEAGDPPGFTPIGTEQVNSTKLDALVDEPLAGSPSLVQAQARVRAAQARAQQSRAALLPSVALNAQAAQTKQSYNNGIPPDFVPEGYNDTGRATLDLNFDLDLWGKNRAALAAATSEATAAEMDAAQARLMLTTSVVGAYAELSRAFAVDTEETDASDTDEDFAAGRAAVQARQWDEGIRRLQRAEKRHPDNADLHNLLGYAFRHMRDFDASFRHYKRALEIDPRHRGAHEYIGEAYLQIGDVASAEKHLAALKQICLLPCEEYDDLNKALVAYRNGARKR